MTLHDLSQLLYLRKEIAVEQRRLEELEYSKSFFLIYRIFVCSQWTAKHCRK